MGFFFLRLNGTLVFFVSFPLCCCLLPKQIIWQTPALQSHISCPDEQKSQEKGESSVPDLGVPLSPKSIPSLPHPPGNNIIESTVSLWKEVIWQWATNQWLFKIYPITNSPVQYDHSNPVTTSPVQHEHSNTITNSPVQHEHSNPVTNSPVQHEHSKSSPPSPEGLLRNWTWTSPTWIYLLQTYSRSGNERHRESSPESQITGQVAGSKRGFQSQGKKRESQIIPWAYF